MEQEDSTNDSMEMFDISPYPNNMLSAEFDITEQIYLTNKTYKIEASFQHVYGHQDTKSRGEMSIKAVLNVEADRLAGN